MLKILVVTYHPWREDISVGNTLSNIFRGMEDKIEFANLYVRDDKPCNEIVKRFFHISERAMFRNLFSRKEVGEEVLPVKDDETKETFSKAYNKARRLRWNIFLLAQDLLGVFSKWKSDALDDFINDFSPDIVFGPLGRVPISNRIMFSISRNYNIPVISYPWDDHFSLKKYSLSPFFWIKLFLERHYIKKCARQSDFLYTITPLMKEEYSKIFRKECKLLYKGFSFERRPNFKETGNVIKLTYMGNIGAGRYETLKKMVNIINDLNEDKIKFELDIYTVSPITDKIKKSLNTGACHLFNPVPSNEVMNTMQKADILLHVEPQSLKDKLLFRLSFSTKIVDYLYNAKCILAVGDGTGTIDYLKKNDSALIAKNIHEIRRLLETVYYKPDILKVYSDKAWACGLKNHKISNIQEMVFSDFKTVVNNARHANK